MSIKNSIENKKRWKDEKYRKNISNKVSNTLKGRKHTFERRLKTKINSTNRTKLKGTKRTEETKKKIKETKKRRKYNYHKHHLDTKKDNDKKENLIYVTNQFHNKIHNSAYLFLSENNLIDNYLEWFKKKYNVKIIKNSDNTKTLVNKKFIKVAMSGYYDPLHVGHLECLEKSKNLGNWLTVIINNDMQAKLKKGKSFMVAKDRKTIIENLKMVDEVIVSIDKDKSVCKSLKIIKPDIFTNGGDRNFSESPETLICKKLGIKLVDGLGKKIRSSSDLTGIKNGI